MKKHAIASIVLASLLFAFNAYSQSTKVNDWIDYSKTYFIFSSPYDEESEQFQKGIFRISYETLAAAGMDNIIGEHLQMFCQGKELPVYVSNSGPFDSGDYVEFYGSLTDGAFDTQLYKSPEDQPHSFKSLFSERNRFYLTLNAESSNLRLESIDNDLNNPPEKLAYYNHTNREVFSHIMNFGESLDNPGNYGSDHSPEFSKGEGRQSIMVSLNTPRLFTLDLDGYDETANQNIFFETKLGSYFNHSTLVGVQRPKISVNNLVFDDSFEGFDMRNYYFTLSNSSINTATNQLEILYETLDEVDPVSGETVSGTRYGVYYHQAVYPRRFEFNNTPLAHLNLSTEDDTYFEMTNFDGGESAILIDLTSRKRMEVASNNGIYPVRLNYAGQTESEIVVNAQADVHFLEIEDVRQFFDFSRPENQGDYLIIINRSFSTSPCFSGYIEYRTSEMGGSFTPVFAEVDELYHQYSYGIDYHPLAIKNLVSSALEEWETKPAYLYLVGKSQPYWDVNRQEQDLLVPSYGHVFSDAYLSSVDQSDYRPRLATGRLPVEDANQLCTYLTKLEEYELLYGSCSPSDRAWMSKSLLLVQGIDIEDYHNNFDLNYNTALELNSLLTSNALNYVTAEVILDSLSSARPAQPSWYKTVNDGVAIVNYIGGSQYGVWNINGPDWPESMHASGLSNKGKYPFIFSPSASTAGNVWRDSGENMATNYLLERSAGAIAYLGGKDEMTSSTVASQFGTRFYELAGENDGKASIAQLVQKTIGQLYAEFVATGDNNYKISAFQLEFMGDPAVRLYSFKKPDFSVSSTDISLAVDGQLIEGEDVLEEPENLEVSFNVDIFGPNLPEEGFQAQVDIVHAGGATLLSENYSVATVEGISQIGPLSFDVSQFPAGEYAIVVKLLNTTTSEEVCTTNNVASTSIQVNRDCAEIDFEIIDIPLTICQHSEDLLHFSTNMGSSELVSFYISDATNEWLIDDGFSLAESGTYEVQAIYTAQEGCISFSNTHTFVILPQSNEACNSTSVLEFNSFPDKGNLFDLLKKLEAEGALEVDLNVFDVQGKMLLSKKKERGNLIHHNLELPNGLYIYQIRFYSDGQHRVLSGWLPLGR